ncbi:PREDICTED: palmitoyl-monogalactosyldiacylglycerol delta-7 desaturase, chloroplastic-like [Ipomoea nil]|uniref:palmitoyl-monogalactosyldiacylglycerol delta-7 desaturase, chloroplastic-like n=1 Tax=Ipomoea nil TaxID=35883 RepID=UPI000901164E|nr:PREDICTED: palmitoyl-monogalactosyldiacylglycerol delta-7 desaturase, chloroplastic-like [Ipomoea nil]
MALFLSLSTPNAKSLPFSPQIYPLRRQTQTGILLRNYSSICRGQNPFTYYRNGEIQHTLSRKLSPIVRAAETPAGSDDNGEDMTSPPLPARMLKFLDVGPGSPAGAVLLASTHLLCLFAPFCFTWDAAGVALGLAVVTALGVTLSYHRNLCHRSFKIPKWLEYLFAYCGVHALQGDPIGWVSTHRQHHQHCDSEKDPHSPIQGFWYSHLGWMLDFNSTNERGEMPTNVGDLESQFFYKFIQRTYIIHPILLATLLYVTGGFPYVVWGMGVRAVLTYQITFLVNSACHLWGTQAWNTGDLSRNNWLVAMLSFGEGWHNNHHTFEYSARHGLEWWQLDITWYVVRALQAFGLATDVKLPTDAQKKKMALTTT